MEEIRTIQTSANNKQPSNLEAEQALLGSILINNDMEILTQHLAALKIKIDIYLIDKLQFLQPCPIISNNKFLSLCYKFS